MLLALNQLSVLPHVELCKVCTHLPRYDHFVVSEETRHHVLVLKGCGEAFALTGL